MKKREYLLSGEVSDEDWDLARQFLGKLGLSCEVFRGRPGYGNNSAFNEEKGEEPTLPYRFAEVTDPNQYLSSEHFEEFWITYRTELKKKNEKRPPIDIVRQAFRALTPPRTPQEGTWEMYRGLTESQRVQVGERLGLDISTREDAGFGKKESYGKYVLQVGSLIDFVKTYDSTSSYERVIGFGKHQLPFVQEMVLHLERQIDAASKT